MFNWLMSKFLYMKHYEYQQKSHPKIRRLHQKGRLLGTQQKNHSNQSRFSLRLDSQQIKNAPHTTKVQGADLEEDPGCTEKQCNQEKKNGDMMRFIPY